MVPVSATVWREGHEALGATLMVRYLVRHTLAPGRTPRRQAEPPCRIGARGAISQTAPLSDVDRTPPWRRHGLSTARPGGPGGFSTSMAGVIRSPPGAIPSPPSWTPGRGEAELNNDLLVGADLLERGRGRRAAGSKRGPS